MDKIISVSTVNQYPPLPPPFSLFMCDDLILTWVWILSLILWIILNCLRWNSVSQHQCPAGGEELQWASLHRVPLADGCMGSVHGGHVHSHQQHICGPKSRQWRLLLSRDANSKGHLCSGQCGPGSSQKVRVNLMAHRLLITNLWASEAASWASVTFELPDLYQQSFTTITSRPVQSVTITVEKTEKVHATVTLSYNLDHQMLLIC